MKKETLKRALTHVAFAAVLNLGVSSGGPARASTRGGVAPQPTAVTDNNDAFSYGVDVDGVPFAQRADGTKGRYLAMSPSHFKVHISKAKDSDIGDVEFVRLSKYETLTTFSSGGVRFGVRKLFTPTAAGRRPEPVVTFEMGGQRVAFKSQAGEKNPQAGAEVESQLARSKS